MSSALIAEDQLTPIISPMQSLHILSNTQRKSGKCEDVKRLHRRQVQRKGYFHSFTHCLASILSPHNIRESIRNSPPLNDYWWV